MKPLIDRIVKDEEQVEFQPNDSYRLAYREFVRYFRELQVIERHHLIIGANFVYGWMPTILEFKCEDLERDLKEAVQILNRAKSRELISEGDLQSLKKMINNSLVGTSKLLHFVNPNLYSIWDSNVYWHLHRSELYAHRQTPSYYYEDLDACRKVTEQSAFAPVFDSITRKLGYEVSPLRAVEVVMFMTVRPK